MVNDNGKPNLLSALKTGNNWHLQLCVLL